MLDNETPDSTNLPEVSTPAPRRRRRAASRPAGPPVVAVEQTPEPTPPPAPDPVVTADAPAANAGRRSRARTSDSTQTGDHEQVAASEQDAAPVKKSAATKRATSAKKATAKKAPAAKKTAAAKAAPVENAEPLESAQPVESPAESAQPVEKAEPAKRARVAKKATSSRTRSSSRTSKPVAAETDEPGETRGGAAASDRVFDAPWSAAGHQTAGSDDAAEQERSREPRPIVADPFAVPEIDVTGLRPRRRSRARASTETSTPEPEALAAERLIAEAPVAESLVEESAVDADLIEETSDADADDTESTDVEAEATDAETTDAETTDAETTDAETTDAETTDEGDGDSESADDEASDDSPGRRRRRRRGGRRRRRSGGDDDSGDEDSSDASDSSDATDSADGDVTSEESDTAEDSGESESRESGSRRSRSRKSGSRVSRSKDRSDDSGADADDDSSDEESADDESAEDESSDGTRRRRRRRRRRTGEDTDETARRRANDAVTGIDGSTRLEAKRQRRREGREAGRRRAPILSESEFLARRESVKRAMVIRQREGLSQIAVLEDTMLVEHYVDHSSSRSLIGNVYLGRVQNVLPSMEAAFIDLGHGRNAVLYAGEVDWDAFGGGGGKERKIESVLKSGQSILVQVTKDPVGAKGARLTHHISLPGRYIVYSPGGHLSGISRKLPDTERKRLKQILSEHVDETASVIVRTAAEGASEEELVRDVSRLKAQWETIEKKVKNGGAPLSLYTEPDPTVRIVRDLFTEDFAELIIAGTGSDDDAYDGVVDYVQHVAPHLADRIHRWDTEGGADVFAAHRIDEQIAKALERKVHLPSGGSLIIDRTEAMTVIDVNTGKFTGSGGNLEATVTSNNLEAAEEIVRQLRLRDIGGIIVIDFIDMVLPNNRELLLRRLVECLGRDRTRHQVAEVTSLGLVQMTRKRIGTGLGEAFNTACDHCQGKGYVSHDDPVETDPDQGSTGNGGGGGAAGGAGGRARTRGGRSGRRQAEAPKAQTPAPARQPLPKIMPPPPPGLAKASTVDEANSGDVAESANAQDELPTESWSRSTPVESTTAEPASDVAAALAALVAGTGGGSFEVVKDSGATADSGSADYRPTADADAS